MIRPALRAMRPLQWTKNVLVFAAPAAAGVLDEARPLGLTLLTFVAFCLAASGTYLWNDLADLEADRRHPTKRTRAIASGDLSESTARALGVLLPLMALGLIALTGRWQTVAVLAVYIALTLSYTVWLKHVPVVDLLTIASGFVLRAAAGAAAVDVAMSRWFVLCVVFGSLFIVVGKRYAELNELGNGSATRATLATYTTGYLRILLSVSLAGALISYCVWAFEASEISPVSRDDSDWPFYEASVVPMIAALFRYLFVLERGEGAAPEEVFARDRVLQVAGAAWVVIYGLAVYAG
ncbi:MAG: decaprenyl-phosphate phosphoribosyltransferase [Actinomycetota bacterium]